MRHQRDTFDMDDMRIALEKQIHLDAEKFVQQQLEKRELELQQQFSELWEQNLQLVQIASPDAQVKPFRSPIPKQPIFAAQPTTITTKDDDSDAFE